MRVNNKGLPAAGLFKSELCPEHSAPRLTVSVTSVTLLRNQLTRLNTSVRFSFAFSGDFERYRDVSPVVAETTPSEQASQVPRTNAMKCMHLPNRNRHEIAEQ